MTFLGDEGRDVLVVKRMIVDHKFTLLGPTASVGGFFMGPIYYYFMAPFLWLWQLDPVGPAVMVALFGVATILLIYLVGKDFFGIKAGLIAAFFYAISPLVIAYSRSSWNPNLVPFFSLLTLYLLYKGLVKNSWPLFFISGILFGITLQLHYVALFLALIIIFCLVLMEAKNLRLLLRYSFFTFIGFIIGFSPFLAFELRHGFQNIQSIFRFILSPGPAQDTEVNYVAPNIFQTVQDLIFRLFWRLLTNFPPLYQITISESTTLTLWYWGMIVLTIISLGLLLVLFLKKLKINPTETKKFALLLLWLFIGGGSFYFYKKPIYDYYLGFMFPLPFLLVGNFLSKLLSLGNAFKVAALIIFLLLTENNLGGAPFRFTPNRQLNQAKEISRFVLEKTEGKPFNFALITGQNSDHAYRYFLEIWGAKPVTIEYAGVDPERKTVTDQLLVVCEVSPCQPLGNSLWEVAGFGRAEIAGEWNVSVVKVYRLVRYKGPT